MFNEALGNEDDRNYRVKLLSVGICELLASNVKPSSVCVGAIPKSSSSLYNIQMQVHFHMNTKPLIINLIIDIKDSKYLSLDCF